MSGMKEDFLAQALQRLREDDVTVLQDFLAYQRGEHPFFNRVEVAHEFLDLLTFKIKESRSQMNKEALASFSFEFIRDSLKVYGYNHKFVAVQYKALITYYQNQRNLDKAIEVCEMLIRHGITDDESRGFHIRLDDLYRLRRKVLERGGDFSGIFFPSEPEEDNEEIPDEPA